MEINHDKKFIFIAVARTASTSIKVRLNSPLNQPPNIYHASISKVLKENPDISNYFKWAFVRNPWDRFVSSYFEFKQIGHSKWANQLKPFESFESFLYNFPTHNISKDIHFIPQIDCLSFNGKVAMDKICRFESLQKDFNEICQRFNLELKNLSKFRKNQFKGNAFKYTDFYTSREMVDIIRKFYYRDVDFFNYKFGE